MLIRVCASGKRHLSEASIWVFMKWNPVCYMHSKTGPRYKQNLPQRQNLVHEGDFSQALTNSIFSLVESLKSDSWVRRLWGVRFIEFHQMCCVRQRKQRFAHFGGFWGFFNWIIFSLVKLWLALEEKSSQFIFYVFTLLSDLSFSLLFCCYIVFICLLFIPWLFQNRREKQSLVLHQSLASWTHNEATEDMTALWPSVRHPQIGPCWSYTSPVQEGGSRMFSVFISPSPMTVSLWMPRLLLPVNHFRALTWGEAAEALSCKIGLCWK